MPRTPNLAWRLRVAVVLTLAAVSPSAGLAAAPEDEAFFESKIRPVLAGVCFRCHGGEKQGGELRVDSREHLLTGGESGPAVRPGEPAGSLLLAAIRREETASAMPPDEPLDPAAVRDFEAWIRAGAPWPAAAAPFAAAQHWAFAPLQPAGPLPVTAAEGAARIDALLAARRAEFGAAPVAEADRRTLLRRVTFDLTGLPPTPEESAAFLADEAPDAFARVVERLLASPHYGERWGRHWLDVVRYADTAGETADFPLPEAWRYRNYVIAAFNADKPYDEFVREQLAGDLLAVEQAEQIPPERYAELIAATGYLAIARRFGFDIEADHYLTLDDTVDTLGKSLLGLSLGCARCHDHKYDPISVEDYYGLYGIFASTRYPFSGCEKVRAPRDLVPLVSPAEWERQGAPQRRALAEQDAELARLEAAQAAAGQAWTALWPAADAALAQGAIDDAGAQSFADVSGDRLNAVELHAGEMLLLTVLPQGNHGADTTLLEWRIEPADGGPAWSVTDDLRADLLAGNPHADRQGQADVWWLFDVQGPARLLSEAVPDVNGKAGLFAWRRGDTPSVVVNASDAPIDAWTRLTERTLFIHPGPQGGAAIGWLAPRDVTVRVSGRVADAHPTGPDGVAWRLDRLPAAAAEHARALASADRAAREVAAARAALAATAPEMPLAYAMAEGAPTNVQVHLKGDPKSLGPEVPRGTLRALGGGPLEIATGSGRRELVEWLLGPARPLLARVIVNRVWKHHFGVGLVRTPNDFGVRGEPPSHPALLDELAAQFLADGWSFKALHRRLLLTQAYRLGGRIAPEAAAADPDNVSLWRFPRRRLSAEEIRDSLLAVSGELDRTPGQGHPFPPQNQWGFTQHNPFRGDYDHSRRSVYLMTQRIRRHPLLALFDGADAAASTPDRFTTTAPTQALFFLNDPLVHRLTDRLAERLLTLPDDSARLERAFALLFARPPSPEEHAEAAEFLTAYEPQPAAWAAWLRVLVSSNEFVYLD